MNQRPILILTRRTKLIYSQKTEEEDAVCVRLSLSLCLNGHLSPLQKLISDTRRCFGLGVVCLLVSPAPVVQSMNQQLKGLIGGCVGVYCKLWKDIVRIWLYDRTGCCHAQWWNGKFLCGSVVFPGEVILCVHQVVGPWITRHIGQWNNHHKHWTCCYSLSTVKQGIV